MQSYIIADGDSPDALAENVNKLIAQGYIPCGPMVPIVCWHDRAYDVYYQPMIKDADDPRTI